MIMKTFDPHAQLEERQLRAHNAMQAALRKGALRGLPSVFAPLVEESCEVTYHTGGNDFALLGENA